ncbi:MAG TPA: hypothetical protein VGX95_07475 [Xanthobacteraceae bacterium]|jgi:hypothetical protein|nr:hypothetical protein [Xanthobacteraceae bacterium]
MKYATALAAAGLLALAASTPAASQQTPGPGLYEITYGLSQAQICLQNPATPASFGQWHGVQFATDKTKPLASWGGYYGYICDYNCSDPNRQQGSVKLFGMVQLADSGHPGQSFWEAELLEVAPASPGPGWSGRWTYWNSIGISNPPPYIRSITMTRLSDCK